MLSMQVQRFLVAIMHKCEQRHLLDKTKMDLILYSVDRKGPIAETNSPSDLTDGQKILLCNSTTQT